jgi:hypothetical protein
MVHDLWDHIRQYFDDLRVAKTAEYKDRQGGGNDNDKGDIYADLVKIHLEYAILADSHAERVVNSKDEKPKEYPAELVNRRNWNYRMAETLAQYTYKLKFMRSEMVKRGHAHLESETTFLEIWAFLMMRGFCWQHCHTMVEGGGVPSEFWNSRMPIYIS